MGKWWDVGEGDQWDSREGQEGEVGGEGVRDREVQERKTYREKIGEVGEEGDR